MSTGPLKWMLWAPALALLLVGHGFGHESEYLLRGQPGQMWSQVDYDPKLRDPFLNSNEWSYIPDLDANPPENGPESPLRLKHTAKCFSTSRGCKHDVRFCDAKLLGANAIDLFIHESNPRFIDNLRVQVRDGIFTCQFWTIYEQYAVGYKHLIWTTKRQKLALNRKVYRKGDVIEGTIAFECVEHPNNRFAGKEYSWIIKVFGAFKTILE